MIAGAAALARAFPGVPLLRDAHPEIALLAEMTAADDAHRRHAPGAPAPWSDSPRRPRRTPHPPSARAATPPYGGWTASSPRPLPLPARAAATGTTAFAPAVPLAPACTGFAAAVTAPAVRL